MNVLLRVLKPYKNGNIFGSRVLQPEEEIEVSERTATMLFNDDPEAFEEIERRVPPHRKKNEEPKQDKPSQVIQEEEVDEPIEMEEEIEPDIEEIPLDDEDDFGKSWDDVEISAGENYEESEYQENQDIEDEEPEEDEYDGQPE
jgi:hypothetical protein